MDQRRFSAPLKGRKCECYLMRGYEKDFSILLDSNREREAFTIFCAFLHENLKKLYHASLLSHGLCTLFNDSTTTLRLTPTHSSQLARKEPHRKHVEQCHIWGDETRAAYMFVWLCIGKRNHL